MRFIIAIGVLAIAAVLLATGVIQKAFFGGPEFETAEATLKPTAHYLVISGKSLGGRESAPLVTVSGTKSTFVGYGRTEDVMAWIGSDKYEAVSVNKENQVSVKTGEYHVDEETIGVPVAEKEQTIVNPAGSDLWVSEDSGERSSVVTMSSTEGMSVIIASNGETVAPGEITIDWPLPSRIPYANTFIIIGGILAVIGLILYLWALRHMRRQNGPRRGAKAPQPKAIKMPRPKSLVSAAPKGRRSLGRGASFIALGMAGALTLGLASCSPLRPAIQATPTPTANAQESLDGPPPAVTQAQLSLILTEISRTIGKADTDMDADLAATRLIGPALEMRKANYAIRKADASQAALTAFSSTPITLTMPQATDGWPRMVYAVVQNAQDPTLPTLGYALVQNTPRENYHVEYVVTLEAKAKVPTVASPEIGSAWVQPDSKLLLLPPGDLSAAYGSVLMDGESSPYYGLFDLTNDTLVPQVGKSYKDQKKATNSDLSSLEFTQNAGSGLPLALATLDSGAIVTVGLNEIETSRPTQTGATVSPEGLVKLLSGTSSSPTGIESTYGLELVFYVPPLGSEDKIRLLGYSSGLIAARGL